MFNPNTIKRQRPVPIAPLAMLECIGHRHRDDLYDLIDKNRDYLQTFVPWVNANTNAQDVEDFINTCLDNTDKGTTFGYIIRIRGLFTGYMEIRWNDTHNHQAPENRYAHLHYFLGQRYQGFGIMTHTIMAVTSDLFTTYGVERIGIACASHNLAGLRAADYAGYTHQKTMTQGATLGDGTTIDHEYYDQVTPTYQHNNADAIKRQSHA